MAQRFALPISLDQILQKALERWDLAPTLRRYAALERWSEIAGPQISAKSRTKALQGETLVIEVDHPAWVQELNLLKPRLLEKFRRLEPRSGIRDLKFVLK